jgi:hypothetical protein
MLAVLKTKMGLQLRIASQQENDRNPNRYMDRGHKGAV